VKRKELLGNEPQVKTDGLVRVVEPETVPMAEVETKEARSPAGSRSESNSDVTSVDEADVLNVPVVGKATGILAPCFNR
jgi:hypothetical protein